MSERLNNDIDNSRVARNPMQRTRRPVGQVAWRAAAALSILGASAGAGYAASSLLQAKAQEPGVATATATARPNATETPRPAATATPRAEVQVTPFARVQGQPLFDECKSRPDFVDGKETVGPLTAAPGSVLRRMPVSSAARRSIAEIGIKGDGFEGHNRLIAILPEGGHTWTLNLRELRALTVRVLGFCGSLKEVTDWAFKAHVDSIIQASRKWDGQEPSADEVTVAVIKYEGDNTTPPAATLTELKKGKAPIEELARDVFDLTFVDTDGKRAGQPIRGVQLGGGR